MKIAFISRNNPFDKMLRSGVPYSIYQQLAKHNDVFWIKPEIETFYEKILFFIAKLFYHFLSFLGYNVSHTPIVSRIYSKSVQRKLDITNYDCIFTLGSVEVAYIKTNKPIYCRTDAIIESFFDYYVFNVPSFARKWAITVEHKAIRKYKRFFIPSEWVLDEIHKYSYNEPDEKFIFVESGANLIKSEIHYNPKNYSIKKNLRMLFVGWDLKRKGIDVAIECAKTLKYKYNINSNVIVVGGEPDKEMLNSGFVIYAGNKNKNDKKQLIEFYKEFEKADLFLFPTKAECHGIVNCEAAAYGLPIFSCNTGGVSSYCINNLNGRCLSKNATGEDFAEAIYETLHNNKMEFFSKSSRKLYEDKFNWDVWGEKVNYYIKSDIELLDKHGSKK